MRSPLISRREKLMELVMRFHLKMPLVNDKNCSTRERLERLKTMRAVAQEAMKAEYPATIAKLWKAEEVFLPRLVGQGNAVRVLMHTPIGGEGATDLPLHIWAHMGGGVIGPAEDAYGAKEMQRIACLGGDKKPRLQFCWASIDYRLAPETLFPDHLADAVSALKSLLDPGMAKRYGYSLAKVSIGGCSYGAYLLLMAAKQLASERIRFKSITLMYSGSYSPITQPSMDTYDFAMLPRTFVDLVVPCCLGFDLTVDPKDPELRRKMEEISALHQDYRGLADVPVLVVVGEFDPMRDDNLIMAHQLRLAGAKVTVISARGLHTSAHLNRRQDVNKVAAAYRQQLLA